MAIGVKADIDMRGGHKKLLRPSSRERGSNATEKANASSQLEYLNPQSVTTCFQLPIVKLILAGIAAGSCQRRLPPST